LLVPRLTRHHINTMPDGSDTFQISVVPAISQIDAGDWDGCAGTNNPFVSHAFLLALEQSGAVKPETGWMAQHLTVKDANNRLLGVMMLYLKGNSLGEYVFDHGWADAYERAGGAYYPKLLSAVPFTPVTGPKIMINGALEPGLATQIRLQLAQGALSLAKQLGVSSLHINFLEEIDVNALGQLGFIPRIGLQYHWQNNGYESFADFLAALSSRKRKAILKERRAVHESGVEIEILTGPDILESHWDKMFEFYMDTSQRKWGRAYLNREFFSSIGRTMSDKTLLIMAKQNGEIIAGALNLIGEDAIYGRYWGCNKQVQFLHFEVCYHQAIEVAISMGLSRVEAGAQGEHKISRGYLPTITRSAHWIADAGFCDAISDFTKREALAVEHEKSLLMEESPYRKS